MKKSTIKNILIEEPSRKDKEKILKDMLQTQEEALVILRREQAEKADPSTGSDFEKHYKKGDFQSERPLVK